MNNKIFEHSGNLSTVAHFGWQGDHVMSLFYGLIEGYKKGGDELIKAALKDGNAEILDTLIFPIIFLYRHYLELEIKRLYYYIFRKSIKSKDSLNHNICELFIVLKTDVFEQLEWMEDYVNENNPGILLEIENTVLEIGKRDKKGDVFKYLTDKNLKPYFEDAEYVNYIELHNSIDRIYEFFDFLTNIPREEFNIKKA